MSKTAEQREYDPETDRYYPKIDPTASYAIRNKKPALVTFMLKNEGNTEMQSKTLLAHEKIIIDGSRMTKYVFEAKRVGDIDVQII